MTARAAPVPLPDAGGGDRFSIGPLVATANLAAMEAWLTGAAAGDRFVFAAGRTRPRFAAVAALAREWAAAGLVSEITERTPGGWQFMVERREHRMRAHIGQPPSRHGGGMVTAEGEPVEEVFLRCIRRAANFTLPPPSHRELAAAADLRTAAGAPDARKAGALLAAMARSGRISIDERGQGATTQRRYAVLDAQGYATHRTEWRALFAGSRR